MTSFFSNENKTDLLITYLQTDGQTYWKNNGICTTRGLREHSLKIWFSLGGDVMTSFFNENKTL